MYHKIENTNEMTSNFSVNPVIHPRQSLLFKDHLLKIKIFQVSQQFCGALQLFYLILHFMSWGLLTRHLILFLRMSESLKPGSLGMCSDDISYKA